MSATKDQKVLKAYDFVYAKAAQKYAEISGTTDTLAEGDVGIKQVCTNAGAVVITLPSAAAGNEYKVECGNANQTSLSVSPAAADKIGGNGQTVAAATDNKDLQNMSPALGDYAVVKYYSTDGWIVSECRGNWTFEA